MSTSQSTSQATAQTTAPATTTAAPATSTSNSATQDAAGLSQEVPPTTTEGGISGALSALGELSSVVLDALPTQMAFETAAANMNLTAVDAWVKAQAIKDLLSCEENVIHMILSAQFPEGWFAELSAEASGMLGMVLEGNSAGDAGGKVCFTGEGMSVEAHGAISAGPGMAAPGVSLTGADDQRTGFWAEMGVSAGSEVSATWEIDLLEAYQSSAAAALSSVTQDGTAYDLIDPVFQIVSWATPDALKVSAGVEGEGTAGAASALGQDAPTVGDPEASSSLFPTGLSDVFRTGLSGLVTAGVSVATGYDENGGLISVSAEMAAEAAAIVLGYGESDNFGVEISLTARGALPDPAAMPDAATWVAGLADVELELAATSGNDRGGETRRFDSVLDAIAALAASVSGSGDADVTIGDLVTSRDHVLTEAAGIQDLLPFEIEDLTESSNLLFGRAQVKADAAIEIEVPEDMLLASGLLTGAEDEEAARDIQRGVAQQMLGELAEDGSFDLESPPALIRKAEVTVKVEAEAHSEGAAASNGAGVGMTGAVGRTVDLVDHITLPVTDLQRLLSA